MSLVGNAGKIIFVVHQRRLSSRINDIGFPLVPPFGFPAQPRLLYAMAAARHPNDASADLGTGVREGMKLGVAAGLEALATGAINVGAATPFVAPLFVMLKQAKDLVDKAVRNKEDLDDLLNDFVFITEQVVDEYNATRNGFNLTPLKEWIKERNEVSVECNRMRGVSNGFRLLKRGDQIETLRKRLSELVPIMSLAAGFQNMNMLVSALK